MYVNGQQIIEYMVWFFLTMKKSILRQLQKNNYTAKSTLITILNDHKIIYVLIHTKNLSVKIK